MATLLPSPSEFDRVFDEATASDPAALVASISTRPEFWLKNLKALQKAYVELTTTNATLTEKINALEGVDQKIASARESATAAYNALNQALGA